MWVPCLPTGRHHTIKINYIRMKNKIFLFVFCINNALSVSFAQLANDTLRDNALRVYMDATDYIKEEIQFVNYVRDAKDAQVHIISTGEVTGSGGKKITYYFYGENDMKGMSDTISFVVNKNITQEELRLAQVKILKAGLMRYVVKTPLFKYFDMNYELPLKQEISDDRWNNWLFEITLNSSIQGQKTSNSVDMEGQMTASKITSLSKLIIDLNYGYGKDKFEIKDKFIQSYNISKSFFSLAAISLDNHWSTGGIIEMNASTYKNMKFLFSLYPCIEYDIFPYTEANRKQLVFNYSLGYSYNVYTDTTIYNKLEENLFGQTLRIAGSTIQKWGDISLGLAYSNYFHDWSKNNLTFKNTVNLRISKGLGINFSVVLAIIHDQLSLPKAGVTDEEILLQRKELSTQYLYNSTIGVTYTFGSIYNNVVNPRLNIKKK